MADRKRKILDDPLARTTPQTSDQEEQSLDLDKGPTVSTGIGMRTGELEAIDAIAGELGITRNALLRWATRYIILEYRAGRLDLSKYIEIPPEPKRNIRMPE